MSKKFHARVIANDSLLCVGLDPDIEKLPEQFREEEFPQFAFNKWIIDETHEYAGAYKPNTAFYEARGDAGIRELKMTFDYLSQTHTEIFTIADAKRADIGNTNKGYASFLFDYLGADSATVHPYLGREALEPLLARSDKGVIVLCRTSNTGAGEFQDLVVDGKPLWHHVAEKVANEWNENGNCMLVVGATRPDELKKVRTIVGDMTILLPGIGAQGGDIKSAVQAGLNSEGAGLMISASRSIIFSNDPKAEAKKLRDEINLYR